MSAAIVDTCLTFNPVNLVIVIFRGFVLVVCALGGVLCIYLGWRLYKDSMLSRTEGVAYFAKMKFRLVSAGPGVFFAAFGMWLLLTLSQQKAQVREEAKEPANAIQVPKSPSVFSPRTAGSGLHYFQVGASEPPGSPPCLVERESQGSYFVGGHLSANVYSDLQIAIGVLRSQLVPNVAIDDPGNQQKRRVITTLEMLRDGLVND